MDAIFYLYKRTFINRLKRALHKPVTYIYGAFILLYAIWLPIGFEKIATQWKMDSAEGLVAVFTVFAFWVIPANLIAYAKRKGLVFRKSDIHFLFPSPISPKKALLYAHLRTLFTNLLLTLAVTVFCGYIFKVELWRLVLYFFFASIVENLLEGGIMLLLYGNERIGEKARGLVVKAAYGLILIFVIMGVCAYVAYGLSLQSVLGFLNSDMIQLVPVVGWYIAVIHLLFVGPTVVNVVCSAAYAVLLIAILWAALHMRCTGEFYEDAIKFAEDYEEVLTSRRQGRTDVKFGKKKKFGKANVQYKGGYAKALFYRQMLEYKKNKYFIFDINTVAAVIAGVVIAYLYIDKGGFGQYALLVIPGVMAYLIFVFTAYAGKWGKEIESPYTFMLPDTPFRKLWYATLIQHIQAAVNGLLFVLPGAVVMKLSPLTTVLCIVFYVALNACKLYILAVSQALVGNVLGKTGRQLFQLLLEGLAIGFAAIGAVVGLVMGSMDLAYALMIVLLVAETIGFMSVACLCFYRMDSVEA